MTRSSAPASEPRRTRGGAGGAAAVDEPSWYRQKVKIPKRVWGNGRYSPGAVAWHAQITALQKRPERCRASVDRLAGYMGDGKRTGERYLAELSAPGPDGVAELTTIRHTDPAGDGETAERYTRHVRVDEHFALVPVLAAKALRHPLFVLYCALTYAVDTRTPVTAAELGAHLGVTEMTARRMTNELDRLGWITVDRRAGAHGRHEYEIHDRPLRPVPSPPEAPEPLSSDGGSAPSADGGSLAIKEDPVLTDGRNNTPPGGGVRRRRGDRKCPPGPATSVGVLPETFRPDPGPRPYDGPALGISPRVREVLAPVADLLPSVGEFVVRQAAREIGRLLDAGIPSDGLHDQILNRRRRTGAANLSDPGRWLLGAGLAPSPCGLTDCVDGYMIHTDTPCKACADHPRPYRHRAAAPAAVPVPEPPPAPRRTDTPARPRPAPARPAYAPAEEPRIGAPPDGWRSRVAREQPARAAAVFRHLWTGDNARHLPRQPTGT